MANKTIQQAIARELGKHLAKLEVDAEMVLSGIVATIREAEGSCGAWQAATRLKGYELLGKYLGIFTDKVEVGLDNKIIEQLEMGRRRAAGLMPPPAPDNEDENEEESSSPEEPKDQKPN